MELRAPVARGRGGEARADMPSPACEPSPSFSRCCAADIVPHAALSLRPFLCVRPARPPCLDWSLSPFSSRTPSALPPSRPDTHAARGQTRPRPRPSSSARSASTTPGRTPPPIPPPPPPPPGNDGDLGSRWRPSRADAAREAARAGGPRGGARTGRERGRRQGVGSVRRGITSGAAAHTRERGSERQCPPWVHS